VFTGFPAPAGRATIRIGKDTMNDRRFAPQEDRRMRIDDASKRPWRMLVVVGAALTLAAMMAPAAPAQVIEPLLDVPADDRSLERVIERRLRTLDSIQHRDIHVDSDGGIVTLSGTVPTLAEKQRAISVAMAYRGVRGVRDELSVRRSTRNDDRIREDIVWRLRDDPFLRATDFAVAVQDGEVTLSGVVDSPSKRRLAVELVRDIAGVTQINDGIQVTQLAPRSDTEIQQQVTRQLRQTRGLSDSDITVHVNQGRVALHGTVNTALEAELAKELAWVSGVTEVASDLNVRWTPRADRTRVTLRDDELKGIIEHRLEERPLLAESNIDVEVTDGIVTLRGTVPSLRMRQAALNEAQMISGVRRVNSQINVATATVDSEALHDRIHREFDTTAALADKDISVRVDGSTVYLSGQVDSIAERNRAVQIVSRHGGVTEIVNNLEVTGRETIADAALKRAIERELEFNALIDADDINVEVAEGVVTLTGTVDDLSEFHAAVESAFETGARDVVARLRLEDGGMITDDIRVQAKYSYRKD
jgi:osmotically-inducible protein OsmY